MFQPDECKRSVSRLPINPRPINPILLVRLLSTFAAMILSQSLCDQFAVATLGNDRRYQVPNIDPSGGLGACQSTAHICNLRARVRVPQRRLDKHHLPEN